MGRKLFLFDLDGTLLTDEKKVSPGTMEALRQFTDAGNVFAICTGRAVENALEVQEKLGLAFPGSCVVGYNGGEIYDCSAKKSIFRTGVPLEIVEPILDLASDMGIHCQTYNHKYIVCRNYNENLTFYRRYLRTSVIITDHVMEELTVDPGKMIAIEIHDRAKIETFREEMIHRYGDRLTIMFSNPWYLEIVSKNASKGNALVKLAEYLGIPIRDTYAAGDEENDISMIRAAGTGIAMKNGNSAVHTAADIVTEHDNNEDGLVPLIEKAGLTQVLTV